jgi:hypothetical protein
MRWSALVVAILLAASGCLFGPSIECDPSTELTAAECDLAAQAALAKVSSDGAPSKVVVLPPCPRDRSCPSTVAKLFVIVEISFSGTERKARIGVNRETWDAGEPTYPSLARSNS